MVCQQLDETTWIDDYNHVIVKVHREFQCEHRNCPLHNPSNHIMLGFPQRWRNDRHMMERMCSHGIGHPDPDDITIDKTHGCDGCCIEG
jgi:hypothetical protein